MDISVIIPAYNEQLVIEATLRDVHSYLKKKFSSFEVIVVDDGSNDATTSIVERMQYVRLIQYGTNRGKGFAVRRGMLESRGDLMLFMDADNSTNIRELNHFMNEISYYDVIIGSRALDDSKILISQNAVKQTIGRFGNRIIKLTLGLPFNDTQCGFKLFRRSTMKIFQKQKLNGWGFDFEIIFLAQQWGFKIHESPVTWINSFNSRVKPTDYLKSLVELVQVRFHYQLGHYN